MKLRCLRRREKTLKVERSSSFSLKEFTAMITDIPLCIWGECFPVSSEEVNNSSGSNSSTGSNGSNGSNGSTGSNSSTSQLN